ncbi:MAG: capsular polysaccharide synthesis protein, partial [Cyanobacteria bacterium J06560_5]
IRALLFMTLKLLIPSSINKSNKSPSMTIYNFPKTIWISWFQGLENAPDIVKYCYKSWVRRNPGWKVILITDRNIKDYFDVESILPRERKDISIQKRSNIRVHEI